MTYKSHLLILTIVSSLFGCQAGSDGTSASSTSFGKLEVISSVPPNGASNTARDGIVTVIFNHNLNASTVNANTFTITDQLQYSVVADAIIVDANKATFKSRNKLAADRNYSVKISSEIRGANGLAMSSDYIFDFRTHSSQWTNPELVGSATYARTAMNNHGNAITVWWRYNYGNGHYEILMSELISGNWSNAQVISGDATNVYSPCVAMDDNGNAIIVWTDWGDFTNGSIVMIEHRNGAWSAPKSITSGAFIANSPSVVMNNDGKAIIVWEQKDIYKSEYVKGSINDGWSDPVAISNGGKVMQPRVTMNEKGNAIITWIYWTGIVSQSKIFSREYIDGMWSAPTIVSNPGFDPEQYAIALDENDNALAVWKERTLNQDIFRNEYRNGNWLGPVSVSSSTFNVYSPAVAMDGKGNAIMAWLETINSKYHLFISERRDAAWTTPKLISTPGTVSANPFIRMDKSGNAVLLWNQDDVTNKHVYRMQYLNGNWTNQYLMAVSHNQLNNVVYDVAMDGSGDSIMVWDQSDGTTWNVYRSIYQ